jgi:hypothetical protein
MTVCECVSRHSPVCRTSHRHHVWPLGMGGPREPWNKIFVCPNTHSSAHQLLRLWGHRYDGRPPGWILRHFSLEARRLAEDGWTSWDLAGRPVPRERWIHQGANVAYDTRAIAAAIVKAGIWSA